MSVNQPVFALILAVSEENGLEYNQLFDKSVNKEKFIEYLINLRNANLYKRIAIFMDNLSVHKAVLVREKMAELKIDALMNVPYQPDYNPCESCNSKIKNYYKRTKLNRLVNEQEVNWKDLIAESVNQLTKNDVINSVKFSKYLLNR